MRKNIYFWFNYVTVIVPLNLEEMSEEQRESEDFLIDTAVQMAAFDGLDVSKASAEIIEE